MSEDGISRLFCPDCGDELEADEDWVITDDSLVGKEAGSIEDEQGVYAHASCRPELAARYGVTYQ